MKKYKSCGWAFAPEIEEIEVERETATSVFIGGNRRAKSTEYENYFDTWEEAHAWLISRAEKEVAGHRINLQRAQGSLGNIKGMKNLQSGVSPASKTAK